MAYARFGEDSDVYMYVDGNNMYVCCACSQSDDSVYFPKVQQMIDHLQEHIQAGDKVPDYCMERLKSDVDFLSRN